MPSAHSVPLAWVRSLSALERRRRPASARPLRAAGLDELDESPAVAR